MESPLPEKAAGFLCAMLLIQPPVRARRGQILRAAATSFGSEA